MSVKPLLKKNLTLFAEDRKVPPSQYTDDRKENPRAPPLVLKRMSMQPFKVIVFNNQWFPWKHSISVFVAVCASFPCRALPPKGIIENNLH